MSNFTEHPHYAFPDTHNYGMYLRDYFAAKAMPLVMQQIRDNGVLRVDNVAITVAKASYELADAMMKAREL